MHRSRLLALALAAGLTLSTAACGTSDGDDAISKADFIEKADAICKAGDAEIDKAGEDVDGSDAEALNAYFKMAAEKSIAQLDAVRDLGFPEGDADTLEPILDKFEAAFATIVDDPSKAEGLADDPDLEAGSKALEEYGLEECGSDS